MHMKKILLLLLAAWVFTAGQANAQCQLDVVVTPQLSTISCQNPTVQLQATITPPPPNGNLSFQWYGPANIPNILNPVVSTPGTYAFFVYDSLTQCWAGDTVIVTQDASIPQVSIIGNSVSCNGAPVTITAVTPPGNYQYVWSNNATTPEIEVFTAGIYCVTVTDLNTGCAAASCFALSQPTPLSVNPDYFNSGFCGDSSLIIAYVSGGLPPYSYLWSDNTSWGVIFDPIPGVYTVTVTDGAGCTASASVVVENDPDECVHLQGNVLADWNTNCIVEPIDEGIESVVVRVQDAQGNFFYTNTLPDGTYSVELYPGTYTVAVLPPNNLWDPCQNNISLTLNPNQTVSQDFLLKPLALCPAMTVDLGTPWLRRCMTGHYWITYCNQGTQDATDAYIEVLFDPFLTLTGASIPYTDLGNNLFRFDLGTVPLNDCGSFSVNTFVSCNAQLGQTHCTEAIIYPTGSCAPDSAQWSGASLQLNAQCLGDSLDFVIHNAGLGAMAGPLEYVIIEDAVMLMQAPPPAIILGQDETYHVKVPANGSTWRLEVEQEPFHPGNSTPSLTVEGCSSSGQFSTGFVNQFPLDDNDPWVDIDCTQNIGSYDPNDKQGFPVGYKDAHYIEPGTDLEYLIRFQNTGTDTAFTVVIRDELSPWLDPATVKPGASSHPYQFEYYGDRNIKFTFNDILLPDSSTNQAASQGFVSFRVSQKAGVPLETDIYNRAGIFFDFNEVVNTNYTVHRVGKEFVSVSAWQPFAEGIQLLIMPNPVAETAILQLDGLSGNATWQVELLDVNSRPVLTGTATGNQWQLDRRELPSGVYFLRVISGQQILGAGKVTLK